MVKFYKVGGCVRDEILNVPCKDIDFSVEASSYNEMKQEIINRGGKIFLETEKFFTIRALVPNFGAADYVLCRKDGAYNDNRHPDDVQMGTLLDDLSRRDFTMNAMAKGEDGILHDPFHGQTHIRMRRIKCVGNAEDRFKEDALRMLRAIRFSITKDFELDESIRQCLHSDLINNVKDVSVERVWEELGKMFRHNTLKTLDTLAMFRELRNIVFSMPKLHLEPSLKEI